MKTNIKNIFSLSLVSVLLFAFSSCKEVHFNYTPTNECVSFASSTGSFSLDGSNVEVTINRGSDDEALTVNLSLVDTNSIYTLETPSVTFAKGETTATAILSYSTSDLAPATNYAFSLSFDSSEVSPSGSYSFAGSGLMPLEWEDYGKISFLGSDLNDAYGFSYNSSEYKLQKAEYTTNYFKIVSIFGSGEDLQFYIDNDGYSHIINMSTSDYSDQDNTFTAYKFESDSHFILKGSDYGLMDPWISSNFAYFGWENLSDGSQIVKGSRCDMIVYYVLPSISVYLGYGNEYWECTSVN